MAVSGQFGAPVSIDGQQVTSPGAAVAFDADGDGDLDLIIGGRDLVYMENAGGGLFHAPQVLAPPQNQYIYSLKVADLDGNGTQDLVGTIQVSPGLACVVIKNYGGGVFGTMDTIFHDPDYYSNSLVVPMDVADADQDGDMDIFLKLGEGGIQWFVNDGTGSFSPPITIDPEGSSGGIRVTDATGDGLPDILSGTDESITIYTCTGPGTWGTGQQLPYQWATRVYEIEVLDFNGDGILDIVGASVVNNRIVRALGTGGGGFGTLQAQSASPPVLSPRGLSFGDLNGDGLDDIVAGMVGVNMGRLQAIGNLAAPSLQQPVVYSGPGIFKTLVADLNGDGANDILAVGGFNYLSWFPNDGTGTFMDPVPLSTNVFPSSFFIEDLDEDGDTDVLLCDESMGRMIRFLNDGTGGFTRVVEPHLITYGGNFMQLADLDGDGIKDLIHGLSVFESPDSLVWYPGLGGGTFGPKQSITGALGNTQHVLTSMDVADLDGDGDMDIVFTATTGPSGINRKLFWMEQTAPLTFTAPQEIPGSAPDHVRAADLDGDGLPELVTLFKGTTSRVSSHQNYGGESWGPQQVIFSFASDFLPEYDLADLDGDGITDIVASTRYQTVWEKGNGDGTWGASQTILTYPNYSYYHEARPVRCADFDGDGHVDVAVPGSIYLNDGDGTFGAPLSIPALPDQHMMILSVEDLDGDGAADLLWTVGELPSAVGGSRQGLYWNKNFLQSPYSIHGTVFLDPDGDGSQGPGEYGLPWVQVQLSPYLYGLFSGPTGNYGGNVVAGSYELDCEPPSDFWTITNNPSTIQTEVSDDAMESMGNDFGLVAVVDTSLVIPTLVFSGGWCGGTGSFWASFANTGTRVEHGTVKVVLDPLYTFQSSIPPPDNIQGDTLYWAIDSLPLLSSMTIHLTIGIPSSNYMGAMLHSTASFATTDQVFSSDLSTVLPCAYDPNEKQVRPEGYGIHGALEDTTGHLDYTIRFQNTGNAAATNVVLKDPLPSGLDRTKITVLGYSHTPTHISIDPAGELRIAFDGIMLPDSASDPTGSQGFITLRFKLEEGLLHLTEIQNTAHIYFDLNPPIITNTTLTTIVDCSLWQPHVALGAADTLLASAGDAFQWFFNGEPLPDTTGFMVSGANGEYTALVTSEYGCTSLSSPYTYLTTSIVEQDGQWFKAIPNPFTNSTRIVTNTTLTAQHRIQLIDTQGRVLRNITGHGSHSVELPADGIAGGMYLVRILHEGTSIGVLRVVVE